MARVVLIVKAVLVEIVTVIAVVIAEETVAEIVAQGIRNN
jgi:hypothetical protein